MFRRTLILVVALAALCLAEHNPLLPRPKKVRYGSGRLPAASLTIRLPSTPSPEDRFVASWLTRRFAGAGGNALTLKRTGDGPALPGWDEKAGPDSREAYSIKITAAGGEIRSRSSAGLFYAAQTLAQLVEDAALPEVEIEDWPSLAYRGFMMDTSHGGLPTEDEIKRQLDFLARWKANQYYFYSEASIELKGYPLLNPAARYRQEQVRRIVAYGRERHIDVIPCVELYGHMHDLFRMERYAELAPLRYGGEFDPRNPQVLPLIRDWVKQLADLFPSPFLHIGMDETYELEKVASVAAGGVPPGKLYIEHFHNVARIAGEHGKRPMIWADILTKYPEVIPELRGGTIAVPWAYGPDQDYTRHVAPFARSGVPTIIATAVTNWDDITPKFNRTFDNVDQFLAAGRNCGALGLMHTGWTDDAQTLFRMGLPAMAYGFIAPWQPRWRRWPKLTSCSSRGSAGAPCSACGAIRWTRNACNISRRTGINCDRDGCSPKRPGNA